MHLLSEIFSSDFILRNSIYVSLLVGLTCPLVGSYLVVRRLIFLGVALPQVSSCGIAMAFALHALEGVPHTEESEHLLALTGSVIMTLGTIFVLSMLEKRGRSTSEGRIGATYVLAGAWSILLLVKNPYGEHGLLERMRGEIIAVTNGDLWLTAISFVVIGVLLWVYRKELILVSFDPNMAVTLRKKVVFWDFLLFLIIGVTISVSVLSVGPLVTFGFLIIPPLTAHPFAKTMTQFAIASSLIGGITALVGFIIAYAQDLPVGPTDVALLGAIYLLAMIARRLVVAFIPKAAVQNS